MTEVMEIAFPKVDEGSTALVVPPVHDTPVNGGLVTYARQSPAQAKQTLSCKDLLKGDTLTQAEQEAQEAYRAMLDNGQVLLTFGTDALQGVNSLIDRLLHEMQPVQIPELTELMKDMRKDMRGIKKKYDVSDPKVLAKYEKWKGGIWRFFGKAKTMVELLMEDVQSIEKQLDKVKAELTGRQYELMRNVSYYDQLYDENEKEIIKLIYKIGVMELIIELAANDARAIAIGDANLGDRGAEQQAVYADLVQALENKVAEYKGRLFVAWATAPSVRTMRSMNVQLAQRINETVCVTIPSMKKVVFDWRAAAQAQDSAKLNAVVREGFNEWVQAAAKAQTEAVRLISEEVNTPTLTPATINVVAAEIERRADIIVQAMEAGDKRRDEIDAAMQAALPVMSDAQQKVSDALIQRVIGAATRPLEIETSVPLATA